MGKPLYLIFRYVHAEIPDRPCQGVVRCLATAAEARGLNPAAPLLTLALTPEPEEFMAAFCRRCVSFGRKI